PKVAGTFNWMLREIHLQNHNNFGPNFEGISGDKAYEGLDSSKKSLTDMAHGFHKEDFGMNEERRRPEGKGEELGEASFEPFRRQKDEEIAANPRRTEDFVEGKKLINKFSDELYGHMGERINFHSQNLSAKKQGILKARLNRLHENNRNKYAEDFNRSAKNVRATMGRGSTQVAAESTVNDDIQHTNNKKEVKSHLKKYLQEESYSIRPDGNTYSIHS